MALRKKADQTPKAEPKAKKKAEVPQMTPDQAMVYAALNAGRED